MGQVDKTLVTDNSSTDAFTYPNPYPTLPLPLNTPTLK